ncbi:class I SAM-dependent methyltransferase [Acidisoma sp.]|uniref:class I SAM-dependent methyltransferase n=1 Tax=Acidisoma sp. TaxID=1872115 RepID=UPI003B008D37
MSSVVASAQPLLAPGALVGRFILTKLLKRIVVGRLTVRLPSGDEIEARGRVGGPEAMLVLHSWTMLRQLALGGDVGFAESYMDGQWSSPDLPALIELAALNQEPLGDAVTGLPMLRLLNRLRHRRHVNTRRGSRRNIVSHYDLGNDFYRSWLDEGMSYSSGVYRAEEQSLEAAQTEKQNRIMEMLALSGGERVLEIGCGWGGLAQRLVEEAGCVVTGLTLSPAQLSFARERLARPVAAGRADLRLQDYRDVGGRYDRVVSIEMLEAVGQDYWPVYFRRLRDCLKPGGVAVLQVISIAEKKFEAYLRTPDFIQLYVFPGGMLPTVTIMREQVAKAGLVLETFEPFGASYARTLAEWRRRFHAAWPQLRQGGLDEMFGRKWDYYLAYCEAGFRAGALDVGLYRITRPG